MFTFNGVSPTCWSLLKKLTKLLTMPESRGMCWLRKRSANQSITSEVSNQLVASRKKDFLVPAIRTKISIR